MSQKHPRLLSLCPQISFPSLPNQLNQHFLRQPNGGHITGMPQVHAWISVSLTWQILQSSAGAFVHIVAWKAAGWQAHLLPKRASGGREQRAFLTLLYDPDHQGVGEAFVWLGLVDSLVRKGSTSQSNLGLFTWFHTRVIIFTLSIEFGNK